MLCIAIVVGMVIPAHLAIWADNDRRYAQRG